MNRAFSVFLVPILVCLAISTAEKASAEPKTVVVMWEGRSLMADAVTRGFTGKMAQIAPDVAIKIHRELEDSQEAEEKFRQFEGVAKGIVFLRSAGAKFLANANPKLPCFVGACNNPAELGVIKDLHAPEGNITGVTYYIPYDKKFDVIKSLFPKVTSVCLLAQAGHPSGPIERKATREECARRGITYNEVEAANLAELIRGMRVFVGKVDLFIITNTHMVMDNVTGILSVSNPAKIPIFSYAEHCVKRGAVAAMAADDTKLGEMLAESVVDVVVRGKPVSRVPVRTDNFPRIIVNEQMIKMLGISLPEAIAKQAVPST